MAREKSPGLKILWIWTLGTAAILVTNVVRTRLQDMDQLINSNEQQQQQQTQKQKSQIDSIITDEIQEEKS